MSYTEMYDTFAKRNKEQLIEWMEEYEHNDGSDVFQALMAGYTFALAVIIEIAEPDPEEFRMLKKQIMDALDKAHRKAVVEMN